MKLCVDMLWNRSMSGVCLNVRCCICLYAFVLLRFFPCKSSLSGVIMYVFMLVCLIVLRRENTIERRKKRKLERLVRRNSGLD
jgi:hypothetical protein